MPTEGEIYEKAVGPWVKEVRRRATEKPVTVEQLIEKLKNSVLIPKLLIEFPEIKQLRIITRDDKAVEIVRK